MTSKRILEQLYIAAQIGITSKENEKVLKDYYKVVVQDLDRLDQLEKENKELKRLNKNLRNSNTHKDTYASKLKKKNERLLLLLRRS